MFHLLTYSTLKNVVDPFPIESETFRSDPIIFAEAHVVNNEKVYEHFKILLFKNIFEH
jgi:hypothetical protein